MWTGIMVIATLTKALIQISSSRWQKGSLETIAVGM
jgi:hypothetical protein